MTRLDRPLPTIWQEFTLDCRPFRVDRYAAIEHRLAIQRALF